MSYNQHRYYVNIPVNDKVCDLTGSTIDGRQPAEFVMSRFMDYSNMLNSKGWQIVECKDTGSIPMVDFLSIGQSSVLSENNLVSNYREIYRKSRIIDKNKYQNIEELINNKMNFNDMMSRNNSMNIPKYANIGNKLYERLQDLYNSNINDKSVYVNEIINYIDLELEENFEEDQLFIIKPANKSGGYMMFTGLIKNGQVIWDKEKFRNDVLTLSKNKLYELVQNIYIQRYVPMILFSGPLYVNQNLHNFRSAAKLSTYLTHIVENNNGYICQYFWHFYPYDVSLRELIDKSYIYMYPDQEHYEQNIEVGYRLDFFTNTYNTISNSWSQNSQQEEHNLRQHNTSLNQLIRNYFSNFTDYNHIEQLDHDALQASHALANQLYNIVSKNDVLNGQRKFHIFRFDHSYDVTDKKLYTIEVNSYPALQMNRIEFMEDLYDLVFDDKPLNERIEKINKANRGNVFYTDPICNNDESGQSSQQYQQYQYQDQNQNPQQYQHIYQDNKNKYQNL